MVALKEYCTTCNMERAMQPQCTNDMTQNTSLSLAGNKIILKKNSEKIQLNNAVTD